MKIVDDICIVAMIACYFAFVVVVWLIDLGRKLVNKPSILERWSNCW